MTLEELSAVLKIVNDDLEERIATNTPAELYEFIQNKSYTVRDILDKGVLNINFKPGVVVPIVACQKISRPHFIQHYFNHENEAMDWCKKHIAQNIACDPEFIKNIRVTTEDDYVQGCTVVRGEVLVTKHL